MIQSRAVRSIRLFALGAFALAATLLSAAPRAEAQTQVPGGQWYVISKVHFWDGDCQARPIEVSLIRPPEHGLVVFARGVGPIGDFGEGQLDEGSLGYCAGRQIEVTQIIFLAPRDYIGPISFETRVVVDGRSEYLGEWALEVVRR